MASDQLNTRDRGFQYGDGLFETIAIRDGDMRLWSHHYERLARGCARLNIAAPPMSLLRDGVYEELANAKLKAGHGIAKIIVTAGIGERGYGRDAVIAPCIYYSVDTATPVPGHWYRDGIAVALCTTQLATGSVSAGLKTLNRLEQVLARSEFRGTEYFEGLTLDVEGNVICGTMSNVFVVHDGELTTPLMDRCGVEGIMRTYVIENAQSAGIPVAQQQFTFERLAQADELFLTNSQFGLLPVNRCGELRWPVGDLTRKMMRVMAEKGIAECEH